ncbi:hypothetical protein TWF569_006318 [Orbilia oligospora]|nr:hypothetical protein TWF569_006318 [Orbilia oligospora]
MVSDLPFPPQRKPKKRDQVCCILLSKESIIDFKGYECISSSSLRSSDICLFVSKPQKQSCSKMAEAIRPEIWKPPRLVAGTGDIYQTSISKSHEREENSLNGKIGNQLDYRKVVSKTNKLGSNVFRSIEWTADGTSLVAITEDNFIRTFIAPPDLLTSSAPHHLLPYSITPTPTTPFTTSLYPFFTLSDPSTTQLLTSTHSQPIHLRNLLYPHITASYPLIHLTTEKYLTPHSLLWTTTGTHFLAGTDSQIHLFDVTRYNSGPLETFTTGKKRKSNKSNPKTRVPTFFSSSTIQSSSDLDNANTRSIISALSLHQQTNTLAAGTFSRRVLLYSSPYQDGVLTNVINLNSTKTHSRFKNFPGSIRGNGITNISFTENGNHLVVAERRSNVVFIYDLRYPAEVWSVLVGRNAGTNQKLGVSYCSSYGTGDKRVSGVVVAGGIDGIVRIWNPFEGCKGEEEEEEYLKPKEKFVAARDPVTAVAVHPCGEVLATSSGQRKSVNLQDETESEFDSGSEDEKEDEEGGEKREAEEEVGGSVKLSDDGVWDNGVRVWAL